MLSIALCYTSPMSKSTPTRFDLITNDILSMSDDEIIQECIATGESPEAIAAHCREICLNAIALWEERQYALKEYALKGKP